MNGHRPAGNLITYEEAVEITGKHLSTIYRWVAAQYVREFPDINGDERLSEADVRLMLRKKWTRRRKS